jgi:hypothetical protein
VPGYPARVRLASFQQETVPQADAPHRTRQHAVTC